MKKLLTYIGLILTCCFFSSCKEDQLITYEQSSGGENIYFTQKFYDINQTDFFQAVSLGLIPKSKTDSIIKIPVSITGKAVNYDRPISVKFADTSSMILGEHVDFINPPIIRANRINDSISLVLHRTPDLESKRVYLNLLLSKNEHFDINIPVKKNGSNVNLLLSYKIYFDDMFPTSFLWTTFIGKSTIIAFFGEYSRKKVELMLEVLQVNPNFFFDIKSRPSISTIMAYASYMKYWLNKEKSAGRIHLDENNQGINMGNAAQ